MSPASMSSPAAQAQIFDGCTRSRSLLRSRSCGISGDRSDPLIDPRLFRGRNLRLALFANLVVGAALVIAMVDVPIFINAVEVDLKRAALVSGWVLSVLTASMAVTAYVGGRLTERTWYGPPVVGGLVAATVAYLTMGFTWDGDTSYVLIAVQLAVLGAGFGLTVAPTNSAVIAGAAADHRGAAAALVVVTRLLGFSIGLSALTAWGLRALQQLARRHRPTPAH